MASVDILVELFHLPSSRSFVTLATLYVAYDLLIESATGDGSALSILSV